MAAGPLTVHNCTHTAWAVASCDSAMTAEGISVANRKAINAIQPALRCARWLILMGVTPPPLMVGSDYSTGAAPSAGQRLASMTVSAAMLMMRRTDELLVRMCTGAPAPNRKGPTATLLPAAVLSRL